MDTDAVEAEKAEEEERCIADGELLASPLYSAANDRSGAGGVSLVMLDRVVSQKHLYDRERGRMLADRKRRRLTGDDWEIRRDGRTGIPFWYNLDTGEAVWDRPTVIEKRDAERLARSRGFGFLSLPVLTLIMKFMQPDPDRLRGGIVNHSWLEASRDISLYKRVLPVEAVAAADKAAGLTSEGQTSTESGKATAQAFVAEEATGTYRSLGRALAAAQDGDTILLGPGHYWEHDVTVKKAVRVVGEASSAARVVVELTGTIAWMAKNGIMTGVTLRRPRTCPETVSVINLCGTSPTPARLMLLRCIVDNEGAKGPAIHVQHGAIALHSCTITHSEEAAVTVSTRGTIAAAHSEIGHNGPAPTHASTSTSGTQLGAAIVMKGAQTTGFVRDTTFHDNGPHANLAVVVGGRLHIEHVMVRESRGTCPPVLFLESMPSAADMAQEPGEVLQTGDEARREKPSKSKQPAALISHGAGRITGRQNLWEGIPNESYRQFVRLVRRALDPLEIGREALGPCGRGGLRDELQIALAAREALVGAH